MASQADSYYRARYWQKWMKGATYDTADMVVCGAHDVGDLVMVNVCADGGLLCGGCVKSEQERILEVDPDCPDDDQWRIVGQQPAGDGDRCDHCGLAPWTDKGGGAEGEKGQKTMKYHVYETAEETVCRRWSVVAVSGREAIRMVKEGTDGVHYDREETLDGGEATYRTEECP